MMSSTKKWLWVGAWAVGVLLAGCRRGDESPPVIPTATPEPEYPTSFALKPVRGDLNARSAVKLLGGKSSLTGVLCHFSVQNKSDDPRHPHHRTPRLHLLHFKRGQMVRSEAYDLASYAPSVVSRVGDPVLLAGNRCLYRVSRKGSDVGRYQLYLADLKRGTSKRVNDDLYHHDRLLASPDGQRYVFNTSEPYSGEYYHLSLVDRQGHAKTISKERISEYFAWTSRGTLLYPGYAPAHNHDKNSGYPNIYENDLRGNIRLVKEGAYRPQLSPNRRYLAAFRAFRDARGRDEDRFSAHLPTNAALSVTDLQTGKDTLLSRVGQEYPDLVWSADSRRLYALHHFYAHHTQTGYCRISVYNPATGKYRLLTRLEQKGTSVAYDDLKLQPRFVPIALTRENTLLLHVQTKETGAFRSRLIGVDLNTGRRSDILERDGHTSIYHQRPVDWKDVMARRNDE